jgi:HPt (histidine-containing phosphotransfer) domain-containing protein
MNMILNRLVRDKQPPEIVDAARKAAAVKQEQSVLPRRSDDPEFIKVFLQEADKSLATLEALIENVGWHDNHEDMRVYIIHVHTIKTALANIGRLDLSAIALKLEQAARNKINEIVIMETPVFFPALRAFLEELKQADIEAKTRTRSSVLNREIDGLDITNGYEQANADERVYVKILRSYASNVRSLLKTMEAIGPIEEGDEKNLDEYKKTAHAIKGTSYYILASQVGQQAEALEKASGAGDINYVRENNKTFLETAWKLIGDLDEMISAYDIENPRPVKSEPDKEVLSRIIDACRRFDMDDLDEAMEEIEKYRYETDDDLVDWLRDAVNNMDMAHIVERLSELGV